jgi:transcriptional regulator with XRE-family HTH domain
MEGWPGAAIEPRWRAVVSRRAALQRRARVREKHHVMDDTGSLARQAGTEQPSMSALVGERLRAWRREARLSIREVSKLSGLSMSFISLVERGETEIAFTRLVRLTDVFGRGVNDVMTPAEEEARPPRPKIEADEGVRVHRMAGGVEIVYVGEPLWRMQPFTITLEPGAVHGPLVHSYEELVRCLDGSPTMIIAGESISLNPDDVLSVPANSEHVYGNASDRTARLFTVDLRQDISATLRMWAEVQRTLRTGKRPPEAAS